MMLPQGAALASGITRSPNFFQRKFFMRRVRVVLPVMILALVMLALVELSGGRSVLAEAQPQAPVAVDPAAVFSGAAEPALDAMAKEATARQMKGVAVIAFVPGDVTRSWASQMRVVDAFVLGQANVLGIAYAKMSEMADTLDVANLGLDLLEKALRGQ